MSVDMCSKVQKETVLVANSRCIIIANSVADLYVRWHLPFRRPTARQSKVLPNRAVLRDILAPVTIVITNHIQLVKCSDA
jgi:hypothetical protein